MTALPMPALKKRKTTNKCRGRKRLALLEQSCNTEANSVSAFWNVDKIRNTVLDFCELSEENVPIFLSYGNNDYFQKKFLNLSKWEFVKLRQLQADTCADLLLSPFISLFSAIKALCGSMYFNRLLSSEVINFPSQGISSLQSFHDPK